MTHLADDRVRRYFDATAARFDAIYTRDKSPVQRVVDGLFRGVIQRRFQLAMELGGDVREARVLDVGCGSGRYSVELARRGAWVTGLDFAPAMIDLAQAAAAAAGVGERCRFEAVDYLGWEPEAPYDLCLAIGFFDYIQQPLLFLQRIRQQTTGQALFSFPVRWTVRTLSRRLRLAAHSCPVRFYSRPEVTGVLRQAGWHGVTVHRLSRDYLVEARPE